MTTYIALIRGINIGRAKRMAMADLRELLEGMGHTGVRTLLNSGNAVFGTPSPNARELALSIEGQIRKRFGFSAAVVLITAGDLTKVIEENPLRVFASDPARHLVAFVSSPATLTLAKPLLDGLWTPDLFALGAKAAYLWRPNGVIDSKLLQAFSRLTAESATTRNWATVLKLQAATGPKEIAT